MLEIKDLDNCLIICPDSYKKDILRNLSKEKRIIDVKFLSLDEYKKNYFFDYDIKTTKYLMDKYSLSINNANEIIKNLYYIDENKIYDDYKLNKLCQIKLELIENDLLIFNKFFKKEIEKRRILVLGYGKLNKEDNNIINGETIEEIEVEKKYKINIFEDIEDEVEYLYNSICDLIFEKKIDINNIYVLNGNSDYESYFLRFNKYYPFEIEIQEDKYISGTPIAKTFMRMLENSSREEIYEYLLKENNKISRQLIFILNCYPEYELKDVKEFIINDLNNTIISSNGLKNIVKNVEMLRKFNEDDHVFLLGFNDESIKFKNDDDYLSDKLKDILNLSTSEKENEIIKENHKRYLSNIKNLSISYSRKSPFKTYNENVLLSDYEYIENNKSYEYSDMFNSIRYGYLKDLYNKYGVIDEDLNILSKYYDNQQYGSYDNRFDGLSDSQIEDINKVVLSYTSIDNFYKCQFRYYLQYILGLNDYEDSFYTKLGSLAHEVLKEYYEDDNFDFETSWLKNINRYMPEDESESFFMDKMKKEIQMDIEIINKQEQRSKLDKHICEKEYVNKVDDKISFKGLIDKINYFNDEDETLVAIVDYKTGNSASISEKLMSYGLSLQLPSYMYLLRNDSDFEKAKYVGFYLQHLVNTDYKYDSKQDLINKKTDSLKLVGYTSDDISRASKFDESLISGTSENIYGLKTKKDGSFHSRSRIVSDKQIDEMIALVDEKIKDAGTSILKGEFIINPKMIDRKNESCEFCNFKDICFRKERDIKVIHTERNDETELD